MRCNQTNTILTECSATVESLKSVKNLVSGELDSELITKFRTWISFFASPATRIYDPSIHQSLQGVPQPNLAVSTVRYILVHE